MFTQVKQNIGRAQGGLGIGLSLVRRIAELHGGTVSVSSAGTGKGSTFGIRLPLANSASDAAAPKILCAAGECKNVAKDVRILIVDDNIDAGESMAAMLSMKGYATRVAHNGHQALQLAHDFQPELVFLDIGMPGMNGYEVARALRENPKTKAAVLFALTGWGAEEDRMKSRLAGFDEHLTKPANPAVVDAIFAKYFQSSSIVCVG